MVKIFLLKIGRLLARFASEARRAGVRLDGLLDRIVSKRHKTAARRWRGSTLAALLAASLLVFEFAYLALIWPKAPAWTIQGLPKSFQWGSLDFQQIASDRYPISIKSISDIDPDYIQGLLTNDNKYFIALAWRQEGWNEDRLKGEFRDYLAKTYPSQRQLVLPDKTFVTESVFMPENVTMKVLPSFNLRLLAKESHQIAFLIDRQALILSNHPQVLLNWLTSVDKF